MTVEPPSFEAVLETVLYFGPEDRARVEAFYSRTLGLRAVGRWSDGISFRVGAGVLILFDTERLKQRGGPIPAHGAVGPGHACLRARSEAYAAWKERLAEHGVEVLHEHVWKGGRRSLYFRDPAGNLLEIADADLWAR